MSKETDAVKCQLALTIVDIVWIKGLITDEERLKTKAALLKQFEKEDKDRKDEKYWESKLFYKAKGFIEIEPNILEREI